MTTLDFASLPPHYQIKNDRIYAEATGAAEVAFMKAWLQRRLAALDAAMAFAKEVGAQHVLNPGAYNAPAPPQVLGFDVKPTDKAWCANRRRARDKFWRCYPSKTPDGLALRAKMDALPPFPCSREIEVFADLITDISYESDKGHGGGGVGWPFGEHFAYCGERYFLYFDNPFKAMAEWAQGTDESFRFTRPAEGLNWRLGPGWKLLTKAEVDLAFAEHKVAVERAAGAACEMAEAC